MRLLTILTCTQLTSIGSLKRFKIAANGKHEEQMN